MSLALIGILCAIWSLFSRWIGDFLIQRSSRKIGDWETLLVVSLSATILLFPFIFHDLPLIFIPQNIVILSAVAAIFLIMSLLNFESLKRGKISVVEPIFTLEVPVAIFLSFTFLHETISLQQAVLIIVVMSWLILISLKPHHLNKRSWLEAWVLLAFAAAIFEWASNFIVGFSSRINDPLLTIWILSIVSTIISLIYLMRYHTFKSLRDTISLHKKLLTWLSILDNAGWIFFAFAVTMVPIAIATPLSEGYIALASLLGLLINKEKLRPYQKIWFILALLAAGVLAFMSRG